VALTALAESSRADDHTVILRSAAAQRDEESPVSVSASLARLRRADIPPSAFEPAEATSPEPAGCACDAARPTCPKPAIGRRGADVLGFASGTALGLGTGLASRDPAPRALGPFRPVDTGITLASLAIAVALKPARADRGGSAPAAELSGPDGWARRALKAKTVCGEDHADRASYATLFASTAAPFAQVLAASQDHRDRDAAVVAESLAIAGALVRVTKTLVPRARPYRRFCEPTATADACSADSMQSFYSGHATVAFALAIASGQIASMRGQSNAGLVWASGLAVASATGVLRIVADRHHLSDVLVGAGVGSLAGWAVPHFHRTRNAAPAATTLDPRLPPRAAASGSGFGVPLSSRATLRLNPGAGGETSVAFVWRMGR